MRMVHMISRDKAVGRQAPKFPQSPPSEKYRNINSKEIDLLERQGNLCDDWSLLQVKDGFSAGLIRDCHFFGSCRIGNLCDSWLEQHDLRLPIGLYNSTFITCNIGDNTAIHNVHYMAYTLVEEQCILFNIDEIVTTTHAKFGNGLLADGEKEDLRIWLEIANENGGRSILPFDGMLPADAWLWTKYRDDKKLMDRFKEMTDIYGQKIIGTCGVIGSGSVIKNCRILKDVRIGSSAYIKGANKIKNMTINSSDQHQTQIGEGCELVNGIVGFGCRVFYGVKAVRFILCDHSSLKYGARLINSMLGPNSTISCCEVLNSLLFAAHEQHHNSSFLCASIFKGMSNMASAATIGSNHNSRAADGEIVAERGFWPGLSTSLKHNGYFAAFTLIVKGSYPAELVIPLPFSLVANDEHSGRLNLIPGYWFSYNMYALARNAAKTADRDKRSGRFISFEYDWLAPDTVDQMKTAMGLLEKWAASHQQVQNGDYPDAKALLAAQDIDIVAPPDTIEAGTRKVHILHAGQAWQNYLRMIRFYALRTVLESGHGPDLLKNGRTIGADSPWENVGGQMMRRSTLDSIKAAVKSGHINHWDDLHHAWHQASDDYQEQCIGYACELLEQYGGQIEFEKLIDQFVQTAQFIYDGIVTSRQKDYQNRFRTMVYDSNEERDAVLGAFDDNQFIRQAKKELKDLERLAGVFRRDYQST